VPDEIVPFELGGQRFAALVEDLRPAPMTSLTTAEREIALLLRAALSNAEIARARGTSRHTVANQVASLLRKLGVSSRLEIALSCQPRARADGS